MVVLVWQGVVLAGLDICVLAVTSAVVAYAEAVTVLNDNLALPLYCVITLIMLCLGSWSNFVMVI